MFWLLKLGVLLRVSIVFSVNAFGLETEALDETTMTVQDTVPATEESST